MPINNHLIVALGGTGGRMLYAFRRMLYSKHRAFEPATANIRYLYVDSSTIDIQGLAKNYPVLGGSTKLADSSVQAIPGTVGLRAILDNPQAYPTISGWLGGRENFESILNSVPAGRTEASQIRRLGRVLFAQAASPIRSLMIELKSQPQYIKHISDADVSVMIQMMRETMGLVRVVKEQKVAKRSAKTSANTQAVMDELADLNF